MEIRIRKTILFVFFGGLETDTIIMHNTGKNQKRKIVVNEAAVENTRS